MRWSGISASDKRLLKMHAMHRGLYLRIAKKLNAHASFVSRVARGTRGNGEILKEVIRELRKIEETR